MAFFKKTIFLTLTLTVFAFIFSFGAFASDNAAFDKLSDNQGGIVMMSHGGDTARYPANSLEAVVSACERGAELVSVKLGRTSDGVLVLCDTDKPLSAFCETDKTDISAVTAAEAEKMRLYTNDYRTSDCFLTSLEAALSAVSGRSVLVLDNAWELREDVLFLAKKLGAQNSLLIRTDVSSKQIAAWQGSGEVRTVGVYHGGIVWNAQLHLSRLSAASQPLVQYQSKNYFNVMYDNFTAKKYSSGENARAAAPMYDPDLCGQRTDCASYWDEMIDRGFSVIETNSIDAFASYIRAAAKQRSELEKLVRSAGTVDTSRFSQVSRKNFESALKNAGVTLENGNASFSALGLAFSRLCESMNRLTLSDGTDTQKGSLSITAGKAAAVIVFGGIILAGEIYIHKMQLRKKSEN